MLHGGLEIGISNSVVTPAEAAARDSDAKVARSGLLGARQWKWASTAPGITSSPEASISRRAAPSPPVGETSVMSSPFHADISRTRTAVAHHRPPDDSQIKH